ncbi:RraA family protein [Chloroflexota bacterium]
MNKMSEPEMLAKLREFDTPSVTNIVATYPDNPLCLGLYEPWQTNWYTDQSVYCVYPELGRLTGHAVTVTYSLPNPNYNRLSMLDLIDALEKSKKPSILVIKQDFPPEILPKVGLCGGQMTTIFKACGVVGVVTNGPSRDVDEIRPLKFQYIMSGVTPGHGPVAVSAINMPVSVAGMDVMPGDIIHMDENGACKFPADRLADICRNIDALIESEEERARAITAAKTVDELKAVLAPKSAPKTKETGPKVEG